MPGVSGYVSLVRTGLVYDLSDSYQTFLSAFNV